MREGWCRLPSKNCDLVLNEGRKFYVPTGIGTNTEHMQNLAELLYAMSHPLHWERNVRDIPAPGLFSTIFGFDGTDSRYVIRHATGKELATTGKCSHKEYIEGTYTFFLEGKDYEPQPE